LIIRDIYLKSKNNTTNFAIFNLKLLLCNMKTTTVNKEAIKQAIIKMRDDKVAVRSFLQGKTSAETLTSKGIKLVKTI
jgi:hypothetical protein